MIRYATILLLALTLISCGGKPKHYQPAVENPETYVVDNPTMSLPAWVLTPPTDNEHVIGIAYGSSNHEKAIDSARNQAAVIMARNRSSWNVKKCAAISRDTNGFSDEDRARLEFNVSAAPDARGIYDHLTLLHDNDLDGYSICLFAPERALIDTTHVEYEPDSEPGWMDRHPVLEEDAFVSAIASSSSSDLIKAYESALVKARLELAQYSSQKVQAMRKINEMDGQEKVLTTSAIETVVELNDLMVSRMYIRRKYTSGLFSYVVYIEMKMRV